MTGDRIKSVRRYFDESQKQLADALHVSVYSVQAWEQGKANATIDTIIAICKHYGITSDYLLELADDDIMLAKMRKSELTPENRKMLQKFEAYLLYEQKKTK